MITSSRGMPRVIEHQVDTMSSLSGCTITGIDQKGQGTT